MWVNLITDVVNQNHYSNSIQKEALLPPTIQALPEYINTPRPRIKGTSMPGKTVVLFLDGNKIGQTLVDKNGQFSFEISQEIPDGKHKLSGQIKDGPNESSLSLPIVFIVDTTAPELVIESPQDGADIKLKKSGEKIIEVKGQSEAGVVIKVNNRLAKVNLDGSFSVRVPVKEGDQVLKAVSLDKAGNSTQKDIKIKVTIKI